MMVEGVGHQSLALHTCRSLAGIAVQIASARFFFVSAQIVVSKVDVVKELFHNTLPVYQLSIIRRVCFLSAASAATSKLIIDCGKARLSDYFRGQQAAATLTNFVRL